MRTTAANPAREASKNVNRCNNNTELSGNNAVFNMMLQSPFWCVMRYNIFAVLIIVLMSHPAHNMAAHNYGDVRAIIQHVYDGDTLTCNIPTYPAIIGDSIGVRINGIDCAEINDENPIIKAWAEKARDRVTELTKGQQITLREIQRDKYFRILAKVYVKDVLVSDILIKEGLAKKYDGGTKSKWVPADCVPSLKRSFINEDERFTYGFFYTLGKSCDRLELNSIAQKSYETADRVEIPLVDKIVIRRKIDKYYRELDNAIKNLRDMASGQMPPQPQ